jgi:uncharacterized membrane protein (UPF0182 family)
VFRRGRRLAVAIAALIALLFGGRWAAVVLTDRWWAQQVSPAAVGFLTDWHVLRLILDFSGVLLAAAWFIGHLLLVYRAVGSVQVRRNVANLEFREALTPGALLAIAVGTGMLLGLVTGTGTSSHWREVALAWHGVSYSVSEPLQHRDLGLYVAQLPVWRLAHGFFLLLILLGLGIVFALYMLVGAVRWIDGRPAINSHARVHIGWLLVGLALALLWGYLLEPYELIAGLSDPVDAATWQATNLASPILAGVALATAALTAAWALSPRHALVAAGWIVLAFASLVGHWMVPPALGGEGSSATSPAAIERLDRKAYGLEGLSEERVIGDGRATPPPVPSFWNTAAIRRIVAGDSVDVLAVDQTALPGARARRPVWLAARSLPGRRLAVAAVADDRVGPKGQPLFYGPGDSVPRPGPVALLELGPGSFSPLAPKHWLVGPGRHGVEAGGWPRRVMLAWALQAPGLLRQLPAGLMVDWRLAPAERLARLTPFVEWSDPQPRVLDGGLVWLVDGYVAAEAFPLSSRLPWRGRRVGALEAGFLGTVDAASGATHIYLRPDADGLATAWAGISRGVVEPASAIPESVLRQASYPVELFRVQARQLEQGQWKAGSLGGSQPLADPADVPLTDQGWTDDTTTIFRLAAYERQTERHLDAVLWAGGPGGVDALRLLRLDTASVVPSRAALEARWNRFASYDALSDSIGDDGGKLEDGPVRLDVRPSGVVAYQSHIAWSRSGAAVAWISVAAGERLGAGRTLREAWSNLLGASAPSIPGSAQATRLDEARRWLERADTALRTGDWTSFGRAWTGLRDALGARADTAGR